MRLVNKIVGSVAKSLGYIPKDLKEYLEEHSLGVKWVYRKYKDKLLVSFGYATNADVYAIITMVAFKMSEVVIEVQKMSFNGEYELDEKSEVYDLLHGDPNETLKEKIIKASINLNSTGDVFFEKIYTNSLEFPSYLKVLRSADCEIELNSLNEITKINYYDVNYNRDIPYENIIHVKLYDPTSSNDYRGLSPLQAGYKVLDASNDLQTASSKLYKNLGASWLASDKNGSIRTPEEAKILQNAINKRIGGAEKAGQVTVTGLDVELQQLGMTSKDLELIKSQPIKLRQMCSLFGVDSSFFNDPDNSTYATRKEADKSLINNAVKSKLELILSSIERDINRNRTVKIVPKYDHLDALQEDQERLANKNSIISKSISDLLISELSNSQKISILVDTWGYDEESAENLVNGKD